MALYKTSSHSVNNTSTLNDSLTANHHLQTEKGHPPIEDNSLPTKRKRLSITMTEPNATLNTLLPTPCPLVASANESTTMPIIEQTETKAHNISTATATPSQLQSEFISLSTKLYNVAQHQNTLVETETSQHIITQQQKPAVSIPPPSSPTSCQLPPLLQQQQQQQDTSGITEVTETSQQPSTQQQETIVSPPLPLSSISSQLPPISQQQHDTSGRSEVTEESHQPSTQQQETTVSPPPSSISDQLPLASQYQDTSVTTEATETSQQSSTQHEKPAISIPPSSPSISNQLLLTPQQQDTSATTEVTKIPQQTSTQHEQTAISLPSPSSSISNQSPSMLQEAVPPTTPQTSAKANAITAQDALPSIQPVPQTIVSEGRSKRNRKPVEYNVKEWETFKQVTTSGRRTAREAPRWYTQSYMMFLALREHPDHCLSRSNLISAALAMDEKISKERNLPKVFRSKTPTNSASAILTNNSDRYYISYKPEGSRSRWFRLAYTPGNFDHAYGEYRKWMDKLINHDWLYCFGVPLENSTPMSKEDITAFTAGSSTALPTVDLNHHTTDNNNNNGNTTLMTGTDTSSTTPPPLKDDNGNDSNINDGLTKENDHDAPGTENNTTPEASSSTTTTTTTKLDEVQKIHQPMYQLDQLDLSNVPKKWQDIVRVDTSTIPNSGQGLFAVRELPYNTPLGFYFGVPMTEYEFDSIKENVGRASEYSIKYRKTILDATDEHGEPYTLKNDDVGDDDKHKEEPQRLCPFHYMNEAKDIGMANILFVEGVVVNQVICWSKRAIQPGEELLVWYGTEVNRYWKDDSDQQQASP